MVNKLREELRNQREDLVRIVDLIPDGQRVLDLGCGNGALLELLRREKGISGCGVENSQENIIACVGRGVPVIHSDLNQGLNDFRDDTFDTVILSQTIQAVFRPDNLLEEMLRIGRRGIVSFLNFGYYRTRTQLMFTGMMPITKLLPNPWYNTPNIHLATIKDFHDLCEKKDVSILQEIPCGRKNDFGASLWPNLFATTCVFVIGRK